MTQPPDRPSIVKAAPRAVPAARQVDLLRLPDHGWQALLESADVVSEGAIRVELEGPVYYGTTSLLLPFRSRGGLVPDEQALNLGGLVGRDLHARARALRIARREAQVRSPDPIGRVRAELVVRPDPHGIRIDIDVEARVTESALPSTSSARRRNVSRF